MSTTNIMMRHRSRTFSLILCNVMTLLRVTRSYIVYNHITRELEWKPIGFDGVDYTVVRAWLKNLIEGL